mmetsp:Transcript_64151/g.182107  ORF Transcript_64151/g.182107 Transcript_64151/m.182107 type:complete len:216 (-) Transcript_64151:349-996(-)
MPARGRCGAAPAVSHSCASPLPHADQPASTRSPGRPCNGQHGTLTLWQLHRCRCTTPAPRKPSAQWRLQHPLRSIRGVRPPVTSWASTWCHWSRRRHHARCLRRRPGQGRWSLPRRRKTTARCHSAAPRRHALSKGRGTRGAAAGVGGPAAPASVHAVVPWARGSGHCRLWRCRPPPSMPAECARRSSWASGSPPAFARSELASPRRPPPARALI